MAMTTTLKWVQQHLQEVLQDSSKMLNENILEHVDRQVSGLQSPHPHTFDHYGI